MNPLRETAAHPLDSRSLLPEMLIRTSDLPGVAAGIPMFPEFPQGAGGCGISVMCGISVLVGVGRP